MTSCSVKWCGMNSRTSSFQKDGITFHRFPKCPKKKSEWIEATRRGEKWFPAKHSVICSRHFSEDSFHIMKDRRRLLNDATPTLLLPILGQPSSSPQPSRNSQSNSSLTNERPAPDSPSEFNSPIEKRLYRRITELKNIVHLKNKSLKKARGSNRRLKRKLLALKAILAAQENKNVTAEATECAYSESEPEMDAFAEVGTYTTYEVNNG